jgi:hypothetical protein
MIKFSAFAVAESGNKKTGLCSATYASQNSCPDDCALLNAGCYAQKGNTNIYTLQVNRFRDTALQVAKREAQAIDGLPANLDLRLHVVGDCKTIAAAKLVATAVRRYLKRANRKDKFET